MVGKTLDFNELMGGSEDLLARQLSYQYVTWDQYRRIWMTEKSEINRYLFATDTRGTSNSKLPWKNSTTIPKLTQIRDNLHANYMAAMFPHSNWLRWEGNDLDDQSAAKANAITSYMSTKFRQDRSETDIEKMVLDYIDYGNCFGTVEWVDESKKAKDGTTIRGYVGPRYVRISPYDIVFNPLAPSFEASPKIIRRVSTLGELAKYAEKSLNKESDAWKTYEAALNKSATVRKQVRAMAPGDQFKNEAFQIDGFGNLQVYFGSDYVEILTFYGDLYDIDTQTFKPDQIVQIIDRSWIIFQKENDDWTHSSRFFHAGWRQRPDNLYAMGPLDNLVGMQYRIDHLENLKADVFDMIAFPVQKVKGYVQDYEYQPGERIYAGEDGDVEFMHPDTTALQADMQIEQLEKRMEEMAGAPKEAMGIRSPGEKTKFEVQLLDNAASRLFLNKTKHFETIFLEPMMNYALQLARQNMAGSDVTRTLDSDIDAIIFSTITKDDITADGVLRPQGASHFAYRANLLQNMVTLMNSAVMQDPAVKVHLSGKKIAKLAEQLADLDDYQIYGENSRVFEQLETQKLMTQGNEQAQTSASTPPGVTPHDTNLNPTGPVPLQPPPGLPPSAGRPQSPAPQTV